MFLGLEIGLETIFKRQKIKGSKNSETLIITGAGDAGLEPTTSGSGEQFHPIFCYVPLFSFIFLNP